ncbi:MAG: hypothetical protein GY859_38855 [Desulfobacterales bacterium]|nr:hypothetical protein [Desulfobacterales bacterium]
MGKRGEAASGPDGAHLIAGLPFAGDYIVVANSGDYPVRYYDGKTESALADPVDLTTGDRTGVDFILDKGPSIHAAVYLTSVATL